MTMYAQVLSSLQMAVATTLAATNLDENALVQLLDNRAELTVRMQEFTGMALNQFTHPKQYEEEEVESGHGYVWYQAPTPISEQNELLRAVFPKLRGYAVAALATPIPAIYEGLFLIPRWERVAPTYGDAVKRVLTELSHAYRGKFKNCQEDELDSTFLNRHPGTAQKMEIIAERQANQDFLVVPAQFGRRHRGRSARRVREVLEKNEFGLGSFEVACMLLTHVNRLRHYDDLWLDAPGDDYAPAEDEDLMRVPFFSLCDGYVRFGAEASSRADEHCGSVSGCLPE